MTSPTCRCGHDRHHAMVSASPDYSPIGWAFILMGISWTPRKVAYKCRTCEETVELITDKRVLRELPVVS